MLGRWPDENHAIATAIVVGCLLIELSFSRTLRDELLAVIWLVRGKELVMLMIV